MNEAPKFEPNAIGEGGPTGNDPLLGQPDRLESTEGRSEAEQSATLPDAWRNGSAQVVAENEEHGYPADKDSAGEYRVEPQEPAPQQRRDLKPGDIGYVPEVDDNPNPPTLQ